MEPRVGEVEVDEAGAGDLDLRSTWARQVGRRGGRRAAWASSRGLRPAALAVARATLEDQSPCSRRAGRSSSMASGAADTGSTQRPAEGGGQLVTKHRGRLPGAVHRRRTGCVACLAVGMPARTVIRAALALVLGSLALPALTSPGSAGQAPPSRSPSPTGPLVGRPVRDHDRQPRHVDLPGDHRDRADTPGPEVTSVTIDPGETEQVVTSTISGTPMDVTIDGDLDFPDHWSRPLFRCPQSSTSSVTTTSRHPPVEFQSTPASTPSASTCRTAASSAVDNSPGTPAYIPDPGFVGVETIHYCVSSAAREGTDRGHRHPGAGTAGGAGPRGPHLHRLTSPEASTRALRSGHAHP